MRDYPVLGLSTRAFIAENTTLYDKYQRPDAKFKFNAVQRNPQ